MHISRVAASIIGLVIAAFVVAVVAADRPAPATRSTSEAEALEAQFLPQFSAAGLADCFPHTR